VPRRELLALGWVQVAGAGVPCHDPVGTGGLEQDRALPGGPRLGTGAHCGHGGPG